jgi:chromosome segregation protein
LLIREVILQNFMSYEYARIPLKPGLNIICGPNGSGKSSILLALSVALGQSYTERSRKLSDLIRWGADSARITLVFDNARNDGRRPVPKYDMDELRISRYLKRDGTYWFEANFQSVHKAEVTRILREFGINPDNMLIIMHQHMMAEFGNTSTRQRLLLTEEAVGLSEYRRHVVDAQRKLDVVLSEAESVNSLLNSARQTLDYWTSEHERYQRVTALYAKREHLERELLWAQRAAQERTVASWEDQVQAKRAELDALMDEIVRATRAVASLDETRKLVKQEQRQAFYGLMALEKEKAEHGVVVKLQRATRSKLDGFLRQLPPDLLQQRSADLLSLTDELDTQVGYSTSAVERLADKIQAVRASLVDLEGRGDKTVDAYLEQRVREAVLAFSQERVTDELQALRREVANARRDLDALPPLEGQARIETCRRPAEVADELKLVSIQLASLGAASDDIETMYGNYLEVYTDLKRKAAIVAKNREGAFDEVERRRQTWQQLIQSVLAEVSGTYQALLGKIDAVGSVRLVNTHDMDAAGLELAVGFKGAEPVILDAYTQSGGERSSATMVFLLALQHHIKSPIRAVDEFDVHMDPRNRELVTNMLLREIGLHDRAQYLSITPGQIHGVERNAHVITVQNVEGSSELKVMSNG